MAINIEIISKEVIKPSSPTPSHLKNLKLSFLDQIAPPNYIPIILFYQSEFPASQKYSESLKRTLSEILTRFYPLAGRLNDDGFSIDCNDAGVEYVEGQVETQFLQAIENPNVEELAKLLPLNPGDHFNNIVLLAIQISFFGCGGLAVGVCMSHKVGDCSSMVSFINSWASQSLGKTELIPNPDFHSAYKVFPPNDLSGRYKPPLYATTQEQVVTKRFVFDKMKIANLKQELSSITPTSVEAVSAFIWKQLIHVSKAKMNNINNYEKLYVGAHAVNLRSKTSPPLEDSTFGNICCSVDTPTSKGDEQVGQLRDAIRKINGNYVKSLEENGELYVDHMKKLMEGASKGSEGNIEYVFFSSWWRFPFYDVDYGFGKPVWVCTTLHSKNFVVLMSTKERDGIEVWLSALEADMPVLEAQHNLL